MGDVETQTPEETHEAETPEQEQPETPPEEPAEEAKADGEEPAEEEGEKDGEPEQPTEEGKRKRAGGWQRKIERLERDREMLLDRLASQQSGTPPPQQQGREKTPEEKAAEYIDSLVEQRLAAREAQQRQQQVAADFARRTQEVRAAHADFDEVVMGAEHIPVPPVLQEAILTSAVGPEIMYQLASNPAELARIARLPPVEAVREIGRLEAKASGTSPPKTQQRTATRPPAPPTSVSGNTSSTRSLEKMSMADYKRAFRSKP